ncbi:retrovirus-related pol polyprotein from transposon TNT 1-94 [Tanacetum coccineum]
MVPPTNTQSTSNNIVLNVYEASTSHNVFNKRLEDAYFDASTTFHDPSNVHTFYQPYPHEKKWTKDHPLHKIIGDPKSSVHTRGQLANSCLIACLLSSIEPANMAEALKDADWVSAMQDELDQFARLKLVIRNKAMLAAVGYCQQEGINYDDTFSLVVRIEAIRLFLAYDAHKDFTIFQMDVKTVFLNEILKEQVYVGQPPGFVSKQYPNHVYALDKALYFERKFNSLEDCDHASQKNLEVNIWSYDASLRSQLRYRPRDLTALTGVSGAGKTTLMDVAGLLLQLDLLIAISGDDGAVFTPISLSITPTIVGLPDARLIEMVIARIQLNHNWTWVDSSSYHSAIQKEQCLSKETLRQHSRTTNLSGLRLFLMTRKTCSWSSQTFFQRAIASHAECKSSVERPEPDHKKRSMTDKEHSRHDEKESDTSKDT